MTRRQQGFSLISVLVAILVAGVGVLLLARLIATQTAAAGQNQLVSNLTALGNQFWGTVQANPSVLDTSAFAGTFTGSNIGSAPAPLQAWLTLAMAALPSGQAVIATSADASSGGSCSSTGGCTVTLTLQWNQVASPGLPGMTRAQLMYFQFGL